MTGFSPRTVKHQKKDLVAYIENLEKALRRSNQVMDDWIVTYASEFCSQEQREATRGRIKNIGTLAYIAIQVGHNRELLGENVPLGENIRVEKKALSQ